MFLLCMNLLASSAKPTTQAVISVLPVPDVPEIVIPTSPAVEEDGKLLLSGLGMYDADVSNPGDEGLLFDVWLEAVSGRLSLNSSAVRWLDFDPLIAKLSRAQAITGKLTTEVLSLKLLERRATVSIAQ